MTEPILRGAYPASLFADKIEEMKIHGISGGEIIGLPILDIHYKIPKGQWTVVTGFQHCGKSTFLDNILVLLAKNAGWKFLVCSPENQPVERHIASLMEIFTGKKFPSFVYDGYRDEWHMTESEYREAYVFVVEHFQFINPPDTEMTVDGIIDLAATVHADQFKFDGMILDPYNEIEHKRPAGMNESDYVSTVIQKFRAFTRELNIHFWFVAHPTKPTRIGMKISQGGNDEEKARKPIFQRATLYDISGSAHWANKADFGIIIHRDMRDTKAPTIIEIDKVRFRENGERGEVPLYYDWLCNRYLESTSDLLCHRI